MHRGHFNVTQLVDRNGSNTLAVLVDIPALLLANQEALNIFQRRMDRMPYVPGLNSGITDKVWLEKYEKARLHDPDEVETRPPFSRRTYLFKPKSPIMATPKAKLW